MSSFRIGGRVNHFLMCTIIGGALKANPSEKLVKYDIDENTLVFHGEEGEEKKKKVKELLSPLVKQVYGFVLKLFGASRCQSGPLSVEILLTAS